MTELEDRLSSDLPALAEAMLAHHEGEGAPVSCMAIDRGHIGVDDVSIIDSTLRPVSEPVLGFGWGRAALVAIGSGLLVGGLIGFGLLDNSSEQEVATEVSSASEVGENLVSSRSGLWSTLPEAPIEQRSLAAAAWTGSEVAFWAGSSLDRSFAYGDGAAYDPSTNSWRILVVPGWGHPGLSTTFFDG